MIPPVSSPTSPPSAIPPSTTPPAGAPADSVSLGTNAPAPPKGIDLIRLAIGHGPPNALGWFFGPDADKAQGITPSPEGLRYKFEYAPQIAHGSMERLLPKDSPVGWSSAWGEMCRPPFGCWTRREGAWEASCGHVLDDAASVREDALLSLRVPDAGPPEMSLWEHFKGGGGVVYTLDAAAWLRNPSQAPAVVRMQPYEAGQAPPVSVSAAGAEPPYWSQFFGPGAPSVKTVTRDNNEGAGLELMYTWGWLRQVYVPLISSCAPGFVHESFHQEDQLHMRWVRTSDGWVGETKCRPLPEYFEASRGALLRTHLDDQGHVREMVLRVDGRAGDVTEYLLDGEAFMRGDAKSPTVKEVRHADAPPPPPVLQAAPPHAGEVRECGDWILIDGVKVPKRRS